MFIAPLSLFPMNVFRFKQFEVDQSGCAMRINTDGVLLAAMAECGQAARILDIGTGTGVMALMLAQRFPGTAIHAVEIDKEASVTAGRNFMNSPFKERLWNHHTAIEDFKPSVRFDVLVSNPPFFINDLRNTKEKKGIARHASPGFFAGLMAKADELLSREGTFWFILPVKQAAFLIKTAQSYGFDVLQLVYLHSDRSKPAFRWMVCLSRHTLGTKVEHFYIYEREKVYTAAYKELLKDFFLGY